MAYYRNGLCQALSRECSIASVQADNVLEAIRRLEQHPEIRLVVADIRFPHGPDGLDLLDTVKRRWPKVKRVVLSAYTEGDLAIAAFDGVYHAVLDKFLPWYSITEKICELVKE